MLLPGRELSVGRTTLCLVAAAVAGITVPTAEGLSGDCRHTFQMAKTNARFIEPMLLLRTEKLRPGADWLYEIKLDGYRTLVSD